jgi:hypothetical protein
MASPSGTPIDYDSRTCAAPIHAAIATCSLEPRLPNPADRHLIHASVRSESRQTLPKKLTLMPAERSERRGLQTWRHEKTPINTPEKPHRWVRKGLGQCTKKRPRKTSPLRVAQKLSNSFIGLENLREPGYAYKPPYILTLTSFPMNLDVSGCRPKAPEKPHLKNSAAARSERL